MLRLVIICFSLPALAATEEELWEKANAAGQKFSNEMGVPMMWVKGNPAKGVDLGDGFVAYPPTALDLVSSIEPLIAELSIYPPEFLKRSGLTSVMVARGLEHNGAVWGGFAVWRGPRKGTLIVSLADLQWAAIVIHHEVFHLSQHTPLVEGRRGEFLGCNPASFTYKTEGPIDHSRARTSTITEYARTNLEEDEAETFAWTMMDANFVATQSKQDAAIACKVAAVKAFAAALAPAFDDELWKKLAHRKPGTRLP